MFSRIRVVLLVYDAASGAGFLVRSNTCRGRKALDEILFDQHFVSASGGSQCCTFEGFLRKPCSTRLRAHKALKDLISSTAKTGAAAWL